jgi:hypothetical protein
LRRCDHRNSDRVTPKAYHALARKERAYVQRQR